MSCHRIQQITAQQQISEHQKPCWLHLQWSTPVLLDQLTRLTPGDSGSCNTMTSSKRTLEVRPSTSLHSVCTEEHYCKSRHTHFNIYPHNSNRIKQQQNWKLTKLRVFVLNSTVHRLPESHQYSLHWSLEVRPKTFFSTVWCLNIRTLL